MSHATSLDIPDLQEAEIESLLSSKTGAIVVVVSTNWCQPCQLLKPVARKLYVEFLEVALIVALNGDETPQFCAGYNVDSFPQILFFQEGKLVGREEGFSSAAAARISVATFLRTPVEESGVEKSFLAAWDHARGEMKRRHGAADEAVGPLMAAIEPALDAFQDRLNRAIEEGCLGRAEANKTMMLEYQRLTAPFAEKLVAQSEALADGLAIYTKLMDEAVANFARAKSSKK